jgi:hypothetical protein
MAFLLKPYETKNDYKDILRGIFDFLKIILLKATTTFFYSKENGSFHP